PDRRFLPDPEVVVFNASYLMPERQGRLHIASQPAIRREDSKQLMQLTLTARGKPASSDLGAIVRWLDVGHDWIVRGFVDVTTPEMHRVWGLR
ncbi:MAG TPA: hypothetical protein VFL90_14670, partial [Methylomirabilota bacterium]|nr:hypothetical protein [Methylomirabilota bacterium]